MKRAGQLTNALHYFVEAVETLSSRWARDEALTTVNRALLLADHLPETDVNLRYKLKLLAFQYGIILDTKGGMVPQLREIAVQVQLLSEKLNDHTHNFIARTWLRMHHAFHAERIQVRAISEANLSFAQKTEDPMLIGEAYADLGSANFIMGDLINAKLSFDQARHTIDTQIPTSLKKQSDYLEFHNHIAQCYYLSGYLEQAEQWAANALTIAESSNHPITYIVGLELSLLFQVLSLCTSVSLARFWQSQGKHTEAYQLLFSIYNWFTEGFDTPDLIQAKQLLAELTAETLPVA